MKMRGIRTLWAVFLSLLIIYACLGVRNVDASPDTPVVFVEPDYSSGEVGEIFTVDVIVEDVEALYYWSVRMSWNTAVLNVSSHYYDYLGKTVTVSHITHGDFLTWTPDGASAAKYVNYTAGWAEFGQSMFGTYPQGTSGNGWLATVEFIVMGAGETVIDIESAMHFPEPLTYLTNYYDENIPMVAENGYFNDVSSPWSTDINKDGRIDMRDLARVAIKYGQTGASGWIKEDINDDGAVDIADLTLVAHDFGKYYYP
jgi:hypothetical protein